MGHGLFPVKKGIPFFQNQSGVVNDMVILQTFAVGLPAHEGALGNGEFPGNHPDPPVLLVEEKNQVSEQTTVLRHLFSVSQIVASHLVHLYALAMPDYYGYPGITGMQEQFGDRIARYIRMKDVINRLSGIINGTSHYLTTAIADGAPFATALDEAIARANATPYGLAAYAFTTNLSRTWRLAERLEAGTIGINDGVPSTSNCPFGGLKQSGWGRELGAEGIEAFLETIKVRAKEMMS